MKPLTLEAVKAHVAQIERSTPTMVFRDMDDLQRALLNTRIGEIDPLCVADLISRKKIIFNSHVKRGECIVLSNEI